MSNWMLDIETLGTKPDAVVLSIGLVEFNPYDLQDPFEYIKSIYYELEIQSQLNVHNRSIDLNTLSFWMNKDPEFLNGIINQSRSSMRGSENALKMISLELDKLDIIWCKGPAFDTVILENLFNQYDMPAPWAYYNVRDVRTMYDVGELLGVDLPDFEGRKHNALDDAIHQARCVNAVCRALSAKSAS